MILGYDLIDLISLIVWIGCILFSGWLLITVISEMRFNKRRCSPNISTSTEEIEMMKARRRKYVNDDTGD